MAIVHEISNRQKSALENWEMMGGNLRISQKQRANLKHLFPHFLDYSGKPIRSVDFNLQAFVQLSFGLALIGGYFFIVANLGGIRGDRGLDVPVSNEPVKNALFDDVIIDMRVNQLTSSLRSGSQANIAGLVTGLPVNGVYGVESGIVSPSAVVPVSPFLQGKVVVLPDVVQPADVIQQEYEIVLWSYWPSAHPDFCLNYDYENNDCFSPMTSGFRWEEYNQGALACPAEWLFDRVIIEGMGFLPCLDTGTTALCDAGTCTLFILDSSLSWRGVVYSATRETLEN